MATLSDDDLDLATLSEEELAAAWDLWFDLAQTTNDSDPPWTHGVFQEVEHPGTAASAGAQARDA
ncbi:MAG: hypothetical protein KJ066_11550 [Acidobacteria bacterium]|nr:hypothetical protein [Acidobacteriota bacterium]